MSLFRIAIVGCGTRGTAIARAYADHPRTEIAALCDLRPELAAALGAELQVSAFYTEVDRMFAGARPNIVVVATSTEFHYPLCVQLLERGAHVDLEKPICTELEQADAIVERARAAGRRVAVHHQGRVGPSMQAVRAAVAEGRIGALRYLAGSCKGYYGGYGLMNIGCHQVNYLVGLAGPCRSVVATATTAERPITPADVLVAPGGMGIIAGERITATLQFDHGVAATLLLHRLPRVDSSDSLEVVGTEGRLFWQGRAWWLPTPQFAPDGQRDRWQPLESRTPEGYSDRCRSGAAEYAFVDEFVRALDEDRDHACSAREARHVLEVMLGIFEAAAYGRRVDLPQPRRDHPLRRWRREAGLPDPEPTPHDYASWAAAEDARLGRSA